MDVLQNFSDEIQSQVISINIGGNNQKVITDDAFKRAFERLHEHFTVKSSVGAEMPNPSKINKDRIEHLREIENEINVYSANHELASRKTNTFSMLYHLSEKGLV